MVDPVTLGLISRGTMASAQLAGGFLLRPKQRPKYRIPGEIEEATNRAQINADATSDSILQNDMSSIDQAGANAVQNVQRTATSGSDVVGSAGQIAGQIANSKMQANRGFAQRKIANEGRLDFALDRKARFQDKAFDFNVNQPYQERIDTSNALFQAGLGNATDAIDMGVNQSMIRDYNQETINSSSNSNNSWNTSGVNEIRFDKKIKNDLKFMINKKMMDSLIGRGSKFYQTE